MNPLMIRSDQWLLFVVVEGVRGVPGKEHKGTFWGYRSSVFQCSFVKLVEQYMEHLNFLWYANYSAI